MNRISSPLLSPVQLTPAITLKNKVVMAPMTRRFADDEGCPSSSMSDYYAKRANAGLIITEGTLISEDAIGYGNIPGIYNEKQILAWKNVTAKVHAAGGVIFVQLWHCGRVSHPSLHKGNLPISSSGTTLDAPLGNSGLKSGESRAATEKEISGLINDYANAAKNAILAGFDGVEIHGANGYLVDQFLHYCTNKRKDDWGYTPENMSRFCLEVIKACVEKIGKERVGIRLSPGGHMSGIVNDPYRVGDGIRYKSALA